MKMNVHVSLEQAKDLVEFLEAGEQEKADALVGQIQNPINSELFAEIGKLTRQLHDSLTNFQIDSRYNKKLAKKYNKIKNQWFLV